MNTERVEDYFRDLSYERRIVVFYDILGWRFQIDQAANDPRKIGQLRRELLNSTRIIAAAQNDFKGEDIRSSSFSDNIVISQPVSQMGLFRLLGSVGCLVLGAACNGFLVRGGVTIGDLIHDSECVFGPGLNRAYELESTVANLPRVVIDSSIIGEFELPFFVEKDGDLDLLFIDPFTSDFLKLAATLERPLSKEVIERSGVPADDGLFYSKTPAYEILAMCIEGLKLYLRIPLSDKDFERFAWLYDRLAKRVGMPPTSSYPRTRK